MRRFDLETLQSILGGLFVLLAVGLSAHRATAAASEVEQISANIIHAETYYWLGMAERGHLQAFQRGQDYLALAEVALSSADLPATERARLEQITSGLHDDLSSQADMAHDTLHGVFPLLLTSQVLPFINNQDFNTFELVDDADVMAVTDAARKLASAVIDKWTYRPQLDVVFTSEPRRVDLENEALYVFNELPKFFVHNAREVGQVLSPRQLDELRDGKLTQDSQRALQQAFGVDQLLQVHIKQQDVVDGIQFFVVQGRILNLSKEAPELVLSTMGFSRDRRSAFSPAALVSIGLLVIACVAYYARLPDRQPPTLLIVPFVAFTLGFLLPFAILFALQALKPAAETLAILGFWWPPLVAVILYSASLLVWRTAVSQLAPLAPILTVNQTDWSVLLAITFGVSSYLMFSLFAFSGLEAVFLLVPFLVGIVGATWLTARALEKTDHLPRHAVISAGVLFCLAGTALFRVDALLLWMVAAIALGTAAIYNRIIDRKRSAETKSSDAEREQHNDAVSNRLVTDSGTRYVSTEAYERALEYVSAANSQGAKWLFLTGKQGAGKTACAKALFDALRRRYAEENQKVTILEGRCREDLQLTGAFSPFRQALHSVLNVDAFSAEDRSASGIDSAVSGLVETLVPFANLFLSAAEEPAGGGRGEVFDSVVRTLKKLSQRGPTILLIDDIQWADESSRNLLKHLMTAIPEGAPYQFLVVLCSAGPDKEAFSDDKAQWLPIDEPDRQLRERILVECCGVTAESAKRLASDVNMPDDRYTALYWLLKAVNYFRERGLLRDTSDGLALTSDYSAGVTVDLQDLRQHYTGKIPLEPEKRHTVGMAACIGEVFRLQTLSAALGISRLALIQRLDQIAKDTGLVLESQQQADAYAFVSAQAWHFICQDFGVEPIPGRGVDVPLLAREYHARVAEILVAEDDGSNGALGRAALHYCSAGTVYVRDAFEYCVRAARVEAAKFNFSGARKLLRLADERAGALRRKDDVEWELLCVDAEEAHVSGGEKERDAIVARLIRFRRDKRSDDPRTAILLLRALYDARHYSGVERVASDVIETGVADALVRAEVLQFLGLAEQRLRKEGAKTHLREAYVLTENAADADLGSQKLRARIADALAGTLAFGNDSDRAQALELYRTSLRIKERSEVQDGPGQAMTHGGLGRLAYYKDSPDHDAAKYHFRRDLELSVELGDPIGQSQMHSLLGEIALKESDPPKAVAHYQSALEAAGDNKRNQVYAILGLIGAEHALHNAHARDEAGEKLVALLPQAELSEKEIQEFRKRLSQIDANNGTAWRFEALNILDATEQATNIAPQECQIAFRFVPMGTSTPMDVAQNEIWLDVGNRIEPRLIDHHVGTSIASSTTQIVFEQGRELVAKPLASEPSVTLVLHRHPDLDAIGAAWLAQRILRGDHPKGLSMRLLVEAITRHDQGYVEDEEIDRQWATMMNLRLAEAVEDDRRVEIGLQLLDKTLHELQRAESLSDIAEGLATPEIRSRLATARRDYERDISNAQTLTVDLPLTPIEGMVREGDTVDPSRRQPGFQSVDALFLAEPASELLKELARVDVANASGGDGFALLVTSRQLKNVADVPRYRHMISVDPAAGVDLSGIGRQLEHFEKQKEDRLDLPLVAGRERMGEGQGRHGYSVASPWYDGRGHGYTVVDSPSVTIDGREVLASLLTPEEVRDVILEYAGWVDSEEIPAGDEHSAAA